MKKECCDFLEVKSDGVYVDCTLGAGGHALEILKRGGRVVGLDQDPDAVTKASEELKEYIASGRLEIIHTNFRHIHRALTASTLLNGEAADGVLMDLGVSSHQIDEATRGFSFGRDGPLDMRMNQGAAMAAPGQLTAMRIVNEFDVTQLADLLYHYGDEERSRQVAREIVSSRPLRTTGELEEVVGRSIPSFKQRAKTAAKCFQALRIAVNDELGALEEALRSMPRCIKPGGRLVVMSYHSLEDRRVKNFFRSGALPQESFTLPTNGPLSCEKISSSIKNGESEVENPWRTITKRAVTPSEEEIAVNKRSRSAKLRVAEIR